MRVRQEQTLREFLFARLDEDLHRSDVDVDRVLATRRTLEAARHPLTLQILARPYRAHPDYRSVVGRDIDRD